MLEIALLVSTLAWGLLPAEKAAGTAEEVMDAFAAAIGGPSAWEALGAHAIEGSYTGSHLRFYGVDELPFETRYDGAGCWRRSWPTSGITETILPQRGWRSYPAGSGVENREMSSLEHAYLAGELPGAMLRWREIWSAAELRGESELDGEPVVIVELSHRSADLTVERHFSLGSGLLLVSRGRGDALDMATRYDDYRETAGVRLAFRRTVDAGPDEHHVYAIRGLDPAVDVVRKDCSAD